MTGALDEEILAARCPACRGPMLWARRAWRRVKRRTGAVGGGVPPVVEVAVLESQEVFACGLGRSRLLEDGRWREWAYDPDQTCSEAQSVAMRLREELAEVRGGDDG